MEDTEITAESEAAVSVVTDTTRDSDDQGPDTPRALCALHGLTAKTSGNGTPSWHNTMATKLGNPPEESPLIPVQQSQVFTRKKTSQSSQPEDDDTTSELSVPLIPVLPRSSRVCDVQTESTRTLHEVAQIEESQSLLPQTNTQMAALNQGFHPTQPAVSRTGNAKSNSASAKSTISCTSRKIGSQKTDMDRNSTSGHKYSDKRDTIETSGICNNESKTSNSKTEVKLRELCDGHSEQIQSQPTTSSSKSAKTSVENNCSKMDNFSQPLFSQVTVTSSKSTRTGSSKEAGFVYSKEAEPGSGMEAGLSSQRLIKPSPLRPASDSTERINMRLQKLLGDLDKVPRKQVSDIRATMALLFSEKVGNPVLQMLVMEAAVAQCVTNLQDNVTSKLKRLATAYTTEGSDILKKLLQMIQSSISQIIQHHRHEREQLSKTAKATTTQLSKLEATIFKLDMQSLADRQKRVFGMYKKQKEMVEKFKSIRVKNGESVSLPSSGTTTPVKLVEENIAEQMVNKRKKTVSNAHNVRKVTKPVYSLFANIENKRRDEKKRKFEEMKKKKDDKLDKEYTNKESYAQSKVLERTVETEKGKRVYDNTLDTGINININEDKSLDDVGNDVDTAMMASQDITTIPDTQEISTQNDGAAAGILSMHSGDVTADNVEGNTQDRQDSDCVAVDSDGETRCNMSDIVTEGSSGDDMLTPVKRRKGSEEFDQRINTTTQQDTAIENRLGVPEQPSRSEMLWSGMMKQSSIAEKDPVTNSEDPNPKPNHVSPNQLPFQGEVHFDNDNNDEDDVAPMPPNITQPGENWHNVSPTATSMSSDVFLVKAKELQKRIKRRAQYSQQLNQSQPFSQSQPMSQRDSKFIQPQATNVNKGGKGDAIYRNGSNVRSGFVDNVRKPNKNTKNEICNIRNGTNGTTKTMIRNQPFIEKNKDISTSTNYERGISRKYVAATLPGFVEQKAQHIEDTIESVIRQSQGTDDGDNSSKAVDSRKYQYSVPVSLNVKMVDINANKPTVDASKSWLSMLPKSVNKPAQTVNILKPQAKIPIENRPTNSLLIATSVGNATESSPQIMIPVSVNTGQILKPQSRDSSQPQLNAAGVTVTNKPSESTKPTLYPALKELIQTGQLSPGRDVLSVNVMGTNIKASLTETGLIQTGEGTVFSTPVRWLYSLTDGEVSKKGPAYKKIHYNGQPLASYCKPPGNTMSRTVPPHVKLPTRSEDEIKLNEFLSTCRVRLITEKDVIASDDLPDDFWSADFSKVKVSQDIWDCVDCWA